MAGRGDLSTSRRGSVARPQGGSKALLPTPEPEPIADRLCAEVGTEAQGSQEPSEGMKASAGLLHAAPAAPSAALGAKSPLRFTPAPSVLEGTLSKPGPALSFFVRGQPETQGSLRAMRGRIIAANDKELARWRGFVWTTARAAWLGRPTLQDVAIGVDLTFYVVSDRIRRPWMLEPETGLYRLATKGTKDVDKLVRAVFDGITESRVWADDGLVAEVHARAYFAAPPDVPPGCRVDLRVL